MSIASTLYPDFLLPPVTLTSNWKALALPSEDSLRGRTLFSVYDSQGQPADPLLLQVPGAFGFVAPQGYSVQRIHFCNGNAIGAWLKTPLAALIYVASRTLTATVQEQMMDLVQPVEASDGEFGFGKVSSLQRVETPGFHTTIEGPVTGLPGNVVLQVKDARFTMPTFAGQTPDESQLIGVFSVFGDVLYLYGYVYDVLAVARAYGKDKHRVV